MFIKIEKIKIVLALLVIGCTSSADIITSQKNGDFSNDYKCFKSLGRSTFGSLKLCHRDENDHPWVLETIPTKGMSKNAIDKLMMTHIHDQNTGALKEIWTDDRNTQLTFVYDNTDLLGNTRRETAPRLPGALGAASKQRELARMARERRRFQASERAAAAEAEAAETATAAEAKETTKQRELAQKVRQQLRQLQQESAAYDYDMDM